MIFLSTVYELRVMQTDECMGWVQCLIVIGWVMYIKTVPSKHMRTVNTRAN